MSPMASVFAIRHHSLSFQARTDLRTALEAVPNGPGTEFGRVGAVSARDAALSRPWVGLAASASAAMAGAGDGGQRSD